MNASAKVYWLVFAVWQIVGLMVLLFSDVHMNVMPRRIGYVLILPGDLVASKLANVLPDAALPVVVLLFNFGAWYVLRKVWLAIRSSVPEGK